MNWRNRKEEEGNNQGLKELIVGSLKGKITGSVLIYVDSVLNIYFISLLGKFIESNVKVNFQA